METDISETGNIGMKGEKGNRDEWRSVGDVMEIGTDFGDSRHSRGWWSGTDLLEIHQ